MKILDIVSSSFFFASDFNVEVIPVMNLCLNSDDKLVLIDRKTNQDVTSTYKGDTDYLWELVSQAEEFGRDMGEMQEAVIW